MIYFDNAATSYPKPDSVYTEMDRCMREYGANPGRGGHLMSIKAGRAVLEAREVICSFFNISNPMDLVFTKNATEALNLAIYGAIKPDTHVITTSMEHNSVMRPLKTLESMGEIELTVVICNEYGELDPEDIKKSVKGNTSLIVSTLSSNVNGTIMPVYEIAAIAKEHGLLFLLDASQGAGTLDIDVNKLNIDMMAFPGHKGLLGPQGTGGLYVRAGVALKPLMQGGTGSNSENMMQPGIMPDMLESGTLNLPGIVGLRYGVEYLKSVGLENIHAYKEKLFKRFIEGLEDIKKIRLHSLKDPNRNSGIIALNINGYDSNEASHILDRKYSVAVRAGLHCSPAAHMTLATKETGVVRFSPGCFNTEEEVDHVIKYIDEMSCV